MSHDNLTPWDETKVRMVLRAVFDAAVGSADPATVLPAHLPEKPRGRCIVVGAGKASASMAAALDVAWPDVDVSGVVVTRYGHAVPAGRIDVLEAAHPVPDENSLLAANRILKTVHGVGPDDLVIALLSGGGSALMVAPAGEMTLEDKREVNKALLGSGATIAEINAVRKHLSRIKGGRLAQVAHPARVVSLLISDVPGDDPSEIASGPTVPDETTLAEVLEIIARYRIDLPAAARAVLAAGRETPKPDTSQDDVRIIASPRLALQKAAEAAAAWGVPSLILGDALEGEAREMGTVMAGIARSVRQNAHPAAAPVMLLSGGETTVTIGDRPAGKGGRNTEFLLSLACALKGCEGVYALAGDSDGIDGVETAAGAVVTPDTLARLTAAGINARVCLGDHDSFTAFESIGELVVTGPTRTNVNDIRAILIL